MWNGKFCGCGKLAPVSFGLAIGITFFFALLICDLWMMQYGVPPEKAKYIVEPLTFGGSLMHALLALFEGFILGVFVAIFYDLLICCTKTSSCCARPDASCDLPHQHK